MKTKLTLPPLKLSDPCGRIHCDADWSRTRQNSLALRDLEFWLVWKGCGWMRTRDRKLELRPGFCALMRPGGIYDAGHDQRNRLGITFIHFTCAGAVAERQRPWQRWPEFLGVHDVDYLDAVSRRVVELFAAGSAAGAQLLRALLADLLQPPAVCGRRDFSPYHEKILRLARDLHAAGTLPTVEQLAAQLHLSAAHFSRVFKSVTGSGPLEFLLQIRLSRARHLLRETSLGVSEIAARLGYSDVFFFSRQFREKCGLPPLAFRNHRG